MSVVKISPTELANRLANEPPLDLVDVRTPAEFEDMHVQGAKNVPLDRLDPTAVQRERNDSARQPLYVICRSGGRAEQACRRFIAAGIDDVINIDGGTLACESAGLPVVRGKSTMSLERQVRIAAGSLVVLGVVLGYFVHPYFVGLSAFVGAGLVFAGITDTCGMGMLIARMPWNQVSSDSEAK